MIHSTYSPSAAHRWVRCPGSLTLTNLYEEPSSSYAEEGTNAHNLIIKLIENSTYKLNEKIENIEMLNYAKSYIDYIKSLNENSLYNLTFISNSKDIKKLKINENGNFLKMDSGFIRPIFLEQKVYFKDFIGDGFGTVDCFFYDDLKKELHIVDYKYGINNVVDAKDNEQLELYALGIRSFFYEHFNYNFSKIKIFFHIFQPRAKNISVFDISLKSLVRRSIKFKNAIKLSQTKKPPFKSGVKQCKWCPFKMSCPELNKEVKELMEYIENKSELVKKEDTLIEIDLSDENLIELAKKEKLYVDFFKNIKDYIKYRLNNGEHIKGVSLIEKTRRVLKKDWDLKVNDFEKIKPYIKKSISLTQLDKLLSKQEIKEIVDYEKTQSLSFDIDENLEKLHKEFKKYLKLYKKS